MSVINSQTLKHILDSKNYFIINSGKLFFIGDRNGLFPVSFKEEGLLFQGIWAPPWKLLEGIWFSFSKAGSNDIFLDSANNFDAYNGYADHYYFYPEQELVFIRRVFAPFNTKSLIIHLFIKNESKLDINLTLNVYFSFYLATYNNKVDNFNLNFVKSKDDNLVLLADNLKNYLAITTNIKPTEYNFIDINKIDSFPQHLSKQGSLFISKMPVFIPSNESLFLSLYLSSDTDKEESLNILNFLKENSQILLNKNILLYNDLAKQSYFVSSYPLINKLFSWAKISVKNFFFEIEKNLKQLLKEDKLTPSVIYSILDIILLGYVDLAKDMIRIIIDYFSNIKEVKLQNLFLLSIFIELMYFAFYWIEDRQLFKDVYFTAKEKIDLFINNDYLTGVVNNIKELKTLKELAIFSYISIGLKYFHKISSEFSLQEEYSQLKDMALRLKQVVSDNFKFLYSNIIKEKDIILYENDLEYFLTPLRLGLFSVKDSDEIFSYIEERYKDFYTVKESKECFFKVSHLEFISSAQAKYHRLNSILFYFHLVLEYMLYNMNHINKNFLWTGYGIVWPMIKEVLGVRPDIFSNYIKIVPHINEYIGDLKLENLHIGKYIFDINVSIDYSKWVLKIKTDAIDFSADVGFFIPKKREVRAVFLGDNMITKEIKNVKRHWDDYFYYSIDKLQAYTELTVYWA